MKPRVRHFSTEEAKILKSFSVQSDHYGHIAGISNYFRDFAGKIKAGKPPRPLYHLDEEYPSTLRGIADNFETTPSGTCDFGIIELFQAAQDEKGNFYILIQTDQDSYLVPLH